MTTDTAPQQPPRGGSYTRDPITGALTRTEYSRPADEADAPAAPATPATPE